MICRYSSRQNKLATQFLQEKLQGAASYDRIAGYFCSSILEIAGEAIEGVSGKVRIICNSRLSPEDVKVANLAKMRLKQEWCEFLPEAKFCSEVAVERLKKLYALLSSGKLEIRVIPDEIYGLMHGKAGVIAYQDGSATSFLGSINETRNAYTVNYELVWEDNSAEAVAWVRQEFDYFWHSRYAVPLSDFIISDIDRISKRIVISLEDWRDDDGDIVPSVAVEEPVYRKEFGLWEHQKYFVERAFREHKQKGGARLLLADEVGLGKTVQLAMAAKLMALYGDNPVLIIVPKTLLSQWQEEIHHLLDLPSAVWTGKGWVDENGYEYPADSVKSIQKCPRRIGIVSQGLITRKSEAAEYLKQLKYECVILDEAHRARRGNLNKDADEHKAQPNNLLAFLNEITFQTNSLLLATATPVQMNPVEAFDLLNALAMPTEKVMGDKYSVWRTLPQTSLDYIAGNRQPPDTEAEMWNIVRNPFPQKTEKNRRIEIIRNQLDIDDDTFVLEQGIYAGLRPAQKQKIRELYYDDQFILHHNPYIRCIVRRTRDFLERNHNPETGEPYLKKIDVQLMGEKNKEALELKGYLLQAYQIAQDFCNLLSARVQGGGFMSTLLLRRIGSTMLAGENTAKKMLAWTQKGKERLRDLYDDIFDEDEEEEEHEEQHGEIRDLSTAEIDCLERLVKVLHDNRDTDPKYYKVLEILLKGVGTEGAWKEKGCIIFSQYYDSANYVARLLSLDIQDTKIGLYAGGDLSGVYQNGVFTKENKDHLKTMVKKREITVLVGTDAASEGLNLQTLSTLINVDLPWNPTRLEQRKGRIQRIGQLADKIYIYNMRYKDSVEDRVHSKLSDRLRDIYDIFGQLPEVLEDVWVAMAQNNEQKALEAIKKIPEKNPFKIKYEMEILRSTDWEKCEFVLDKRDKLKALLRGW